MQFKKLALATIIGLVCLNQVSYANVRVVNSFRALPGEDLCTAFAGNWAGDAHATALGGLITCHYKGGNDGGKSGATVTVNADGSYTVIVNILKQSDSDSLCPASVSKTLAASCSNGAINITTTPDVQLTGTMTAPTTADLTGTVEIISGVTANVSSMTLNKTSS